MKILIFTLLTTLSLSCKSQQQKQENVKSVHPSEPKDADQIGEYVVETFQDSKGNIWFGTLDEGAAKYDGNKLVYLTMKDGLPSNRIVQIIEDNSGHLWFGSGEGISKYDGKTFTNYSEKDGLCSNMISNLLIDSKGAFWIGTWGGVCKFDYNSFENFEIPYPKVDTYINPDTKNWITVIMEDAKGNIWFGRDGYGACKFDGNSLVHFTTKDGLNSNNVQSIVEDTEGNLWFGTRVGEKDNSDPNKQHGQGGLNKYDGKKVTHFPEIKGFSESDVYAIHRDIANDLWFSTRSHGVYKLVNNEFVNYTVPKSTVSFLKDKKGNVWLGCAGGLYRLAPDGKVMNTTKTNIEP